MTNIADLLRNAKKGTMLWSPLFGPVEFMQLGKNDQIWIKVDNSEPFDKYGRYFGSRFTEAECLLFPSKDCRTWEGWKAHVEPKFKVGDWITDGNITIQIEDVRNNCYTYSNGVLYSTRTADKVYHLWSIADAQDGDVLYFNDNTIVVFKDLYNSTTFHSYCHIEDGVFDISKDEMPDWWEGKGFKPATKEQRDLLFKKMKESGYEWDSDKKELHERK